MRSLLLFLLSIIFISDLSGQCPDRSLLWNRINFLKTSTVPVDDQVKELLPYVHRCEACPRTSDSTFASLLQRLGLLYYLQKDYPTAVNYTRRAIKLLEEKCPTAASTPFYRTKWYNNLQIFYDSLHQRSDCLEALDSCTTIALRSDTVDSRLTTILAGAIYLKTLYYFAAGDYDRCYRNALLGQTITRLYLTGEDSLTFVHNFLPQGFNSLIALGKYDQVEPLLKEKILEFTAIRDTPALGAFMNQLAVVYTSKHNYNAALNYLHQSYASNKSIHYDLGCSQALNNIGYLYLEYLHDYPQANSWCRKALACLPAKRDSRSLEALEAMSEYDNIACIAMARGYTDSALYYFQLAFDQLQPGMNETTLPNSDLDQGYEYKTTPYLIQLIIHKGDAYYSKYLISHNQTDLQASVRIYKIADVFLDRIKAKQSETLSRLAFRKNARALYEHAIRAAMKGDLSEDAFYFFERSRAILLNDQLQQQAVMDDRTLAQRAALRKKILQLERELETVSPDTEVYAKMQTGLFDARQALYRFETEPQNLQKQSGPLSLATLRQQLKKNSQTFFALYAGDSALYSLLVTDRAVKIAGISKHHFDSLARLYTTFISDPERLNRDMPGFVRSSGSLYDLLFPDGDLPTGRIVISPDGSYFPFEALVTNGSVRHPGYMLESHPVCYTYSARYFLDTPAVDATPAGREFMGIAPVQYASHLHLPELPGSSSSLDQIASLFGSPDMFTGERASKASFLKSFSDYRLIQLYTHAVGNNPGKEPLIYFSDSAMALSELISDKRPLTRMIVLSACETANGEFFQGEGVFSFNREFAAIGIPAAVVNLWSVDNQATYQLTEKFYKYLAQGHPADIALQQAKKEFFHSASGEQKLPYYWAAPILTGQTPLLPAAPSSKPLILLLLLPAVLIATGYLIYRYSTRKRA